MPSRASPSSKPSDFWPYLRPYRRTLLIVAGLSMVSAAAALALPLVVRVVLDGLGDESDTGLLIGVLAALMVGGAIIGAFSRYLLARTAEGVVRTTRIRLGAHLFRLPIAEYDQRRTGDLLSWVGSDTTLLSAVVTSGLVELAAGVVVATGAIALMAVVDVPLLLVTVTAVGVGVAVAGTAAVRIKRYSRLAQEAVGAMTASVERALVAVRTIRAYRAEPRETAALSVGADDAYAAGVKVAKVESLIEPVASVAVQAAFLSVLGVGGARVATGQLSVGDLVAFVMLLFLLIEPVVSGLRAWTTLMTGLGALSRIEEVLALPAESDRPNTGADACLPTVPANPRIPATPVTLTPPLLAFDDVDFGYRDGSPVLHHVSFACPRGTTTAVVGPSGAGKSTIMALIERFYEVEGGRILLDGTDVRHLPREHLRRQIGYVEQEAPVLAGTIRENLLLGDPDATDDAMHSALASVNLWRRIADAEGGLDARNEAALQAAVDAVAEDRTLIVVAHRLSTVVRADQIVVLDGGRVNPCTGTGPSEARWYHWRRIPA